MQDEQLVAQQRVFRQQFGFASGQIGEYTNHEGGRWCVMATWHIRSQNDRLRLPDQSFPFAWNSIEERGARVPLAPSERKSPSCKINWRFLAECTQASHADPALEVFFLKNFHKRRGHLGTPGLLTVWSIQFYPL